MSHLHNLLSNIQTGLTVRHQITHVRRTRINLEVLNLLYSEGFINGFSISDKKPNSISVFLKYKNGMPVMKRLKIVSIPSKKVFVSYDTIIKDLIFTGVFVLSTDRYGLVLSDSFIKNPDNFLKTGGEVLFQIIF